MEIQIEGRAHEKFVLCNGVRAVIEKGPASVIKVPPPETTYLAAG
jgi:hypothetical protein